MKTLESTLIKKDLITVARNINAVGGWSVCDESLLNVYADLYDHLACLDEKHGYFLELLYQKYKVNF